jgi:phosphoribosyl-AMP cyclohydrolase
MQLFLGSESVEFLYCLCNLKLFLGQERVFHLAILVFTHLTKNTKGARMKRQQKNLDTEMLNEVKFRPALHRDGSIAPDLIGIILQNYLTKEVLYGASMTKETLKETLERGLVVLYSKTEKVRWLKGETSGDKLRVVKIFLNCNNDQLLIQVIPLRQGVCHEKDANGKGKPTCFGKLLLEIKTIN